MVYILPCPAPAPSLITARSTAEIWSTFLVPWEEKSAIWEKPLLRDSYPFISAEFRTMKNWTQLKRSNTRSQDLLNTNRPSTGDHSVVIKRTFTRAVNWVHMENVYFSKYGAQSRVNIVYALSHLEPNQGKHIFQTWEYRRENKTLRGSWARSHCSYRGGCLVAKVCPTLVTPWTPVHQAPLSMGFPRQENWSGLPFPSPGDLPHPGIESASPALQADSLPLKGSRETMVI